jgi:hypothetical protein
MTDAIVAALLAIRADPSYTTEKDMDEYREKFQRYLADPLSLGKTVQHPVPDELGNLFDGWIRSRLGTDQHRSWRTVMATGKGWGEAMPKAASCYVLSEESADAIKAKLEKEIALALSKQMRPGSTYNAAHMAEAHQIKRLPNGAIWLTCFITMHTPTDDDDDDDESDSSSSDNSSSSSGSSEEDS